MKMNLDELLNLALEAQSKASAAILECKKNLQIWQKSDASPYTSADLASNETLCAVLEKSQIPICSEEKILPFERREHLPYFWLIDPLDGTKGFIKGSKEYAILIALIKEQRPILALIAQPEGQNLFYAHAQSKLYKNHAVFTPDEAKLEQTRRTALISVHYPSAQNEAFMRANHLQGKQISSALKFNALCNGDAGVYVRFERLHSWDIAAGDFLIHHAGGLMCDFHKRPLLYNQPDFHCPPFVALSKKSFFDTLKLEA